MTSNYCCWHCCFRLYRRLQPSRNSRNQRCNTLTTASSAGCEPGSQFILLYHLTRFILLYHLIGKKYASFHLTEAGFTPAYMMRERRKMAMNIEMINGFSRIDFFSNHGLEVNGYNQYLSSPYTRVELGPSRH